MTRVDGSGQARYYNPINPFTLRNITRLNAAFTCDQCGAMSVGEMIMDGDLGGMNRVEYFLEQADDMRWIPLHATGRDFPDVPVHIGDAASEAFECHSIQGFRAACSLARAVIEATAKEKGVRMNGIAAKIDAMAESGFIRPHIQQAAHEVRHLGNEMAHGDFIDAVTSEESALALELMAEVLEEVFQSPARVARARAAREARRAAAES
jgi:hypothetical protein